MRLVLILSGLLWSLQLCAQQKGSSHLYRIGNILIVGNLKTKTQIILRELSIHIGDTVSLEELPQLLEQNRNQIYNTKLFNDVTFSYQAYGNRELSVVFVVDERWYFYPIPRLKLGDRNFNEWWQDRNRDLKRLEAGIDLVQHNLTGHNDVLQLRILGGFTQDVRLYYEHPYIGRHKRWSVSGQARMYRNKSIAYTTENNKLSFISGGSFLRTAYVADASIGYRKRIFTSHRLGLSYRHLQVADTITRLNPDYLLNTRSERSFLTLKYTFTLDKRDIKGYPLKGFLIAIDACQEGLGILDRSLISSLELRINQHAQLHHKLYSAVQLRARLSAQREQPYFFQRGLGWNQFYTRGNDLFVIDGQQAILWRSELKYKAFGKKIKNPWLAIEQFSTIPLAIYPKVFFDAGYLQDSYFQLNGTLENRSLWGTGVGLDIVTYYDAIWRIEGAINQSGDINYFLNFVLAIK